MSKQLSGLHNDIFYVFQELNPLKFYLRTISTETKTLKTLEKITYKIKIKREEFENKWYKIHELLGRKGTNLNSKT